MHAHHYATLASKLSVAMPNRQPIICAHSEWLEPKWAVVVVAYDATTASDMHGNTIRTRVSAYSYNPTELDPQFKHEPYQFGEDSEFVGDDAHGQALLDFGQRMAMHAEVVIQNA